MDRCGLSLAAQEARCTPSYEALDLENVEGTLAGNAADGEGNGKNFCEASFPQISAEWQSLTP